MKTLDPEAEKLKKFMLEHIPFHSLKQAGFWPKGTRVTDYQKQAERVCHWFGYKTVYEYGDKSPIIIDSTKGNVATAIFPGSINAQGEYEKGDGALIRTFQSDFVCPICTCPQEVKDTAKNWQKCRGCKRKLWVMVDMKGDLHVSEL